METLTHFCARRNVENGDFYPGRNTKSRYDNNVSSVSLWFERRQRRQPQTAREKRGRAARRRPELLFL